MNLKESIKRILREELNKLQEQDDWRKVNISQPSDYLGTGGQFEKNYTPQMLKQSITNQIGNKSTSVKPTSQKELKTNDTKKYIVFVCGTNTTGIPHESQYKAFKEGLGNLTNKSVEYFNYDDNKSSNSDLFKWLNENHKNVDKLILFSASCTFANRLSPKYVPTSSTYCIEPWANDNGKKTWTNISPNNFYVNGVEWRRGKGAVDGIPESNQNKLKSHTTALKEAVKVILS
jgi:hypothetical protein